MVTSNRHTRYLRVVARSIRPRAEGDALDPANVDPQVGVQLDIPDVTAGDKVTLSWQNSEGGNFSDSAVRRVAGTLQFYVPREPYAVATGSTVKVSYTIAGKDPSEVLSLHLADT